MIATGDGLPTMARLFISHSSRNNDKAIEVRDWLAKNGWDDVFLDLDPERGIVAGQRWKDALQKAAQRCEMVLALISAEWLASPWCKAEIDAARLMGKKVIVALIGIDKAQVPPDLNDEQWIDLTGDPNAYTRLREGLRRGGLDPSSFPFEAGRRPYPGFAFLEEKDAAIFFGRDAQIVRGLDKIRSLVRAGVDRMLVILGASGSGKSSFFHAGLWPRLKRDDRTWLPLPTIRPERAVISGKYGLTQALQQVMSDTQFADEIRKRGLPRSRAEIQDFIEKTEDGLPKIFAALRDIAQVPGLSAETTPPPTVVLAVDQGEELFNEDGRDEARRFIEILTGTLKADPHTLAILVMRSDSFPQLQNEARLADLPKDTFTLDMMLEGSYRAVIEGPARLVQPNPLKIDPRLTDALLEDVSGQDALPLLAFTLAHLYENYAADNELNLADYEKLGRLKGVIATTVREAFEEGVAKGELPKDAKAQLALARMAFIPHLARVNPAGQFVRRIATRAEIPAEARPLIDRFAERRLLIRDRRKIAGEDVEVIEVAHEAMLREWRELHDALLEEREFLAAKGQLEQDVAEWRAASERLKPGALLSGNKLLRARDWLITRPQDLSVDERQFIKASSDEEFRQRRRKRAAVIGGFIAISVLLVIATVAFLIAREETKTAKSERVKAEDANRKVGEVQQLARHTSDIGMKPQQSLLLSVRAASLSKDGREGTLTAIDGLRQQLRTTGGRPLRGHEMATRTAAFSPDRRWLATGSEEGAIRLWDLSLVDPTSRLPALDGHKGPVHGLAFSADGRWLVSGAADGAVRLWRLTAEGAKPDRVFGEGRYGAIESLALSPNGDWLVFGTQSGNVCIWKMSVDGPQEEPCEAWKDDVPVMQVLFSAGGRWLATSCTGACKSFGAPVRLWDLSGDFPRQDPRRLSHATALVEDSLLAIAFNADETRLAVAYGYVAEVWDLTQENPPQHVLGTYGGSGGWINTLRLSPDNHWLAIGSYSGSNILMWDLTGSRKEPIALKGHGAAVNSAVFSDDGRWLATGSADATARLWDLADPTLPFVLLRGQDLPVAKVVFSPGSAPRHLVTLGDDPGARLWNVPDPLVDPVVMRGQIKPNIIGMAVSSDGNWIATSSVDDSKLVLWSTRDPRQPERELPIPSPSHAIAFSPDGRWLAAKSQDKGVINLWSLADLSKPPLSLSENGWGDVRTLRFSPDNRWLVSGTWAGIVNIWDVSGERPALEPRHRCRQGEGVREPAFSADGRFLATAAQGFSARLWDLASPNPCAGPRVLPHGDVVYQVVFSPDSRWAATASLDQKGRLWDLGAGSEPKLIAEPIFKDRVLQAAFSPDNRWVVFGSWDQTLKLLELTNPGTSKPIELIGHAGRIASVSFSPDSRWLVSASEDRTIRLWDPLDPSAAPVVLRGHEASVQHVGFSKDSRWVITGAYDGTVRLWRLKLGDLVGVACQTAGRDLTRAEARTFLGDERAQQPCAH
jgi:WD40 repeat protein